MATTQNSEGKNENNIKTAADLILKLGVLLFILFLSFKIIWPFLGILIWSLIIADNILKSIIMGQGSSLPSLVVFLGAIVLSLTYKLYLSWISYD